MIILIHLRAKILPAEHCIKGSSGWEIVPDLKEYALKIIEENTFGSVDLCNF